MLKFLVVMMIGLFSGICIAEEEPLTYEASGGEKTEYAKGFQLEKNWSSKAVFGGAKLKALSLPRNFDWRAQSQLSPVMAQGSCGSCWSFSTVATLQDAIAIKDKKIVDLSEQYLVSCNKEGWSCNGGFFAHDYHKSPKGGVPESQMPYTASMTPCKSPLSYQNALQSWAYIPSANENTPPSVEDIKAAIYQYGPISVGVAVDKNFESYKSGVFNNCTASQPNHAVNLVGWNDDGQYWIMRNSWGPNWGESGFMKIKYGCDKIGIAANYIVYKGGATPPPNPKPEPTPTPNPKCSPEPYANAGPSVRVQRFQRVVIGTPGKPGTTYHWESSLRRGPLWNAPQLMVMPMMTETFTVYATTKCGTAKSSMTITVVR